MLDSVAKDATVTFKSNAITSTEATSYNQIIKPSKVPKPDIKLADFRALYNDNVKVFCSCKDFKYRMAYHLTQENSKLGNIEKRPSDITNPESAKYPEGMACKHLDNSLGVLKANMNSILKQFRAKHGVKK